MSDNQHEDVFPMLSEKPTLEQIKDWSCESAAKVASRFEGHDTIACTIPALLLCEQFLDVVQNRTKEEITNAIHEVVKTEGLGFLDEIAKRLDGSSGDDKLAETNDVIGTDPKLGSLLGLLSVLETVSKVGSQCAQLKFLLATTLMSMDERANSMKDISAALGMDMGSEEMRIVRNHLKAGTSDPIETPSESDLDDTMDQLFG